MLRTFISLAAILAMTAPAHAGSVLGGSTLRVSSSADSTASAEMEREDLFSAVLTRFQLIVDVTTGKSYSTPDGSTYDREQCSEDQEAVDDENTDEAEAAESAGPEPIYFAF